MIVAVLVMLEAILMTIELVMALGFPVIVLEVSGFLEIVILMFDLVFIFEILVIAVASFGLSNDFSSTSFKKML